MPGRSTTGSGSSRRWCRIFSEGLWSISPLESKVDIPQVSFYYFHNRVGNVPDEPLSSEASYLFFDVLFLGQ